MMNRQNDFFEEKENKVAKISPFAIVENETLEFLPEDPSARNLFLYEIQERIIRIVNEHIWVSSKMLVEKLDGTYEETEIKKNIKFLLKNTYLRAAVFKTDTGRSSSARALCLGWRGKREIIRLGLSPNRFNELEDHSAKTVKELLSANQLILKVGMEKGCALRKPIYTTSNVFNRKLCFRVAAFVSSSKQNVFFNSVRTHSEDEISEKANRMYYTLKRKNNIISLDKETAIIICICDSENHMSFVKQIIANTKLPSLKNTRIYYVHDRQIDSETELGIELLKAV